LGLHHCWQSKKLSFVKLLETVKVRNGFAVESNDQYRILLLEETANGHVYTVQIHSKDDKGQWVEGEKFTPTDYHGKPWDYIPLRSVAPWIIQMRLELLRCMN
jgi:hypothetical protein